ncbi:nitrate- and nitrite sensing domain-containing protein, partial [Oleiphilus sp. HI0086]
IITLSLVLIVIASVLVWFSTNRKKHAEKLELKNCLAQLNSLKSLLIQIQKHRGLTTGYLHGEKTLQADIKTVRADVNKLWASLVSNHPSLTKDKLFEGISSHWQRLETRALTIEANNNIDQHNRLITNLLYLIENQTEKNSLLVALSREAGLDVIWKELLDTIESIGQTRAIGMGIVSEGKSSALDRIKLKYLNDRVSTQFESLNKVFLERKPGEKRVIILDDKHSTSAIKNAQTKISELQSFIETKLLNSSVDSRSGADFFQLASAAIAPLNELFDLASTKLSTSID